MCSFNESKNRINSRPLSAGASKKNLSQVDDDLSPVQSLDVNGISISGVERFADRQNAHATSTAGITFFSVLRNAELKNKDENPMWWWSLQSRCSSEVCALSEKKARTRLQSYRWTV